MQNGSWIVMFPKDRVPSEENVEAALSKVCDATVTKVEEMGFTVAFGKTSFDVTLNDTSWVAVEAKEFVDWNGDSLANRDEVRNYDARFELLFDNRDTGDLFGYLFSAAENSRLAAARASRSRAEPPRYGLRPNKDDSR